jgi:HK97 family phage major capsid protein
MYKLTTALKAYAIAHLGVKAGASDDAFRNAVNAALKTKKLTQAKLEELTKTKSSGGSGGGNGGVGGLLKRLVDSAVKAATGGGKKKEPAKKPADKGGKKGGKVADKKKGGKSKKDEPSEMDKAVDRLLSKRLASLGIEVKGGDGDGGGSPVALLNKAAPYLRKDDVRVKSAAERYSKERTKAICPQRTGLMGKGSWHPHAGQPAQYDGRLLSHPSELDKAVSGAYFKFALDCQHEARDIPRGLRMTDHDRELVQYALHECEWTGLIRGQGSEDGAWKVHNRKLNEMERKALLDDATSGGLEATPIVFDDAVILTPVLFGELFPMLNVVNITRGRRMEGFSMGNPTFTSGTAEGTAITPFTTTSFIAAFDTTIFNAVAAMEIGMDFEEDSPNDIGGIVVERFGMKSMEWLDRVVAVGDGTTEPTGVFTASAMTAVASDNSTAGPPTVGDYEGLMFGVVKAFRKEPGAQNAFLGNEVSYRRARAIPVGPTDERRVFGMTHGDYTLLDHPYKIQVDVPNNKVCFGNWKRYRMYRRLGLNVRIETAGNYLSIRNLKLIVMRMRFGGQPELGGAFAVMTDAQA